MGSKALKALRLERPLGVGELALALVGLGCIGFLALAPRIRHGGFHLDDWLNAYNALHPPGPDNFWHAISTFANYTIYRPVLVVYVPLTYLVFGTHMHYHLAWSAVLAVLAATTFYGVLRTLDVPWIHAALISALTVVFPWSDATRLWVTGNLVDLSLFFVFTGTLIALQGLRRQGASAWRWHAFAVLFYLLSMFTYEITLPVVACMGALYCFRVGWQAAKWRWLADVIAAVAAGTWVWLNTSNAKSGISGDLSHLKEIVMGGGTLLGRAGYPLSFPETTPVLVAMAVILCLGFCARFGLPDRFKPRGGWGLQDWLALTIGGLVLASLGWAMLIPANPFYTPSVLGEVNRVNALAAFGMVVAVYGTFGIVSALVWQGGSRRRVFATAMTVLLGVALMASYTHVLRRHIRLWNAAYAAEAAAIDKTKQVFPHPPPGTTVFASSYPANQVPGVTILASTWDYNGMLKLAYDDGSLSGYPVLSFLHLACRPETIALEGEGLLEANVAYGTARLLNLSTGTFSDPKSQAECRRVVHLYVPGPTYLSETY